MNKKHKASIAYLRTFLNNLGGVDVDLINKDDLREDLIKAMIKTLLKHINKIKFAIEAVEKNQVLEARKTLGIKEGWLFQPDDIVSTRNTIKGLTSGYLNISLGHLKQNPQKIYGIWKNYIKMYIPDNERSAHTKFFLSHATNIHLYNFHHFVLYQRFLSVKEPGIEVDKFMAFYRDYIIELFDLLANLNYDEIKTILAFAELSDKELTELFAYAEEDISNYGNKEKFQTHLVQSKKQFCHKPDSSYIRTSNNKKFAFFYGEKIDQLPDEVFDKTDLETLTICKTNIREIPDKIKNLTNLKYFHFSGSKIEYLSPEVFKLPHISEVDIIDPYFKSNSDITEAIGLFMAKHNKYFFGKNCWNLDVWVK